MPPPSRRYLATRRAVARLLDVAEQLPAPVGPRPAAVEAMGLAFSGPIGLAAGFDPDGRLRPVAQRLGFGSMEIGTLTADSRPLAIVPPAVGSTLVCGVSIGKRPATPWERAEDDYLAALGRFQRHADYLTLNPGRNPPSAQRFVLLVREILAASRELARRRGRALPVVVKLSAAWMMERGRVDRAASFVGAGAAGLLVPTEGMRASDALEALAQVSRALGRDTCVMSVGGIASAREALARTHHGARLLQVHRAARALHAPRWMETVGSALAAR